MEALGIREDVEFLFDMCGLSRYMTYTFESYQDYTCELLATLEVHFFSTQREEKAGRGFGYATFAVGGRVYSLTIKELDNLSVSHPRTVLNQILTSSNLRSFGTQ